MSKELLEVDVMKEPGLYEVASSSTTIYYVDTRPGEAGAPDARLMRVRGHGRTGIGAHDNQWAYLDMIVSEAIVERDGVELPDDEVDHSDFRLWVLRVGARHRYDYTDLVPNDDSDLLWWLQRVCERITRLDSLPKKLEAADDSGFESAEG